MARFPDCRTATRSYLQVSTAHGLRRSGWAIHLWARVIWFIMFAVAFIAFIYLVAGLVGEYKDYPTKVAMSSENPDAAPYPSVTVCNLNPVKGEKLPTATLDEFDSKIMDATNQQEAVEERLRSLAAEARQSGGAQVGHQLYDMVLYCSYDGLLCDPMNEFVSYTSSRYGNCYTFNSDGKKMATNGGPFYGLTLILNVESDSHVGGAGISDGFRVVVHAPETEPLTDIQGFSVPIGIQASVGIESQQYNRMSEPYGSCSDLADSSGFKQTSTSCAATDCAGSSSCNCIPACSEMMYTLDFSLTDWPTTNHENTLTNMIQTSYNRTFEIDQLASIRLYYKSFQKKIVSEEAQLTLATLLSQIGGLSAFCAGMSFLTLFEFVEMFFSWCSTPCGEGQDDDEPLQPTQQWPQQDFGQDNVGADPYGQQPPGPSDMGEYY